MIRAAVTLALSSALLCATVVASASEPPDVVAECARALGGGNWQQIRTLEIRGTETSLGVSGPFHILRKRPKLYRAESQVSTDSYVEAYDGEMPWLRKDVTVGLKGDWPAPAPGFIGGWIEVEAELVPLCVGPQERGHRANVLGEDDCDGRPCHAIEFTLRNHQVETWYVDAETFLPISRLRRVPYVGHLAEDREYFEDYREISGVKIPFHTEKEVGNLYRVRDLESVEVNVEIADAVFKLPVPLGMQELRRLAGLFKVRVESFMPGVPPLETEATSEIRSSFLGAALTEDVAFIVLPGFHLEVRRFFSYDRFREVFRLAHFDNSTAHLDVLEGAFDGDRLVVSNLATDTGWKFFDQPRHARQTFYELSEDGFKLDVELSTDGGETWSLERRLTYTRAGDLP